MHQIFDKEMIQENIPGIIFASHGPLACGLLESVKMIAGDTPNIAAFSIDPGDDPDDFGRCLMDAYQYFPMGSIVLIDLQGGTPFNQVFLRSARDKVETYAMCSMSMPMALTALDLREELSGAELLEGIKAEVSDAFYMIKRA